MKKIHTLPEKVIVKTWDNVGYHYTSWSNWLKIKRVGLIPYRVDHPDLIRVLGYSPQGIWVWLYNQKGNEHIGNILYQAAMKQELKVVKLRVGYNLKNVLTSKGRSIDLTHDGVIGNWHYHKDTPSRVVVVKIPPDDIELVKSYDLRKLLL